MVQILGGKPYFDLGMVPKNRNFDQRTVMGQFDTDAARFGMCKALCVQWVKRHYLGEGFWEEWLTSNDDFTRSGAQSCIMLMSKDEVIGIQSLTDMTRLHGFGNLVVGQALSEKKAWHTRYLTRLGLNVRQVVPVTPFNPASLANDLSGQSGYLLIYLNDANEAGHCVAAYIDTNATSYIFDPNFGEFTIPGSYASFLPFCKHLHSDYFVLFRLNGSVGDLRNYRIEAVG